MDSSNIAKIAAVAGRVALAAVLWTAVAKAEVPTTTAPRSVRLEALWYRDGATGGGHEYGVTKIRATVTPNLDRGVRIGVFEEYAGATGVQWRSSIWVASYIASVVTGTELAANRFDIATEGYIDGPSAGALMAVGFIAAIAGDKILPHVTMTGALVPDGSVGSVGGIPDKVRASKAAKKRVVGIPAGQATSTGVDGKEIDAIALGRTLGVDVREVADIYEAYALLTGRQLPRAVPVAASAMSVPVALLATLRGRAEAMAKQAKRDLDLLAGDKTPSLKKTIAAARLELRALVRHLARNDRAAAYQRARRAAALARAALRVANLAKKGKDARAAGSFARTEKELERIEAMLEVASRARVQRPLMLLAGYGAVARARGSLEVSRTMLAAAVIDNGKPPTRKALRALQASGKALLPALYLSHADLSLDFARHLLGAHAGLHEPLSFDRQALGRAAQALVAAASGSIEYTDALLLADIAKERKVALADLSAAFAQAERGYLLASQMSTLAVQNGLDGAGQSLAQTLLRLQAAAASYIESASVVTKHYSLDIEVDGEGHEAKARRAHALSALLKRAEVASREAAASAFEQLGVIPPDARFHYRSAVEHLAHGTLKARLRALNEFWRSTLESRTAAMVLRRQGPPPTP